MSRRVRHLYTCAVVAEFRCPRCGTEVPVTAARTFSPDTHELSLIPVYADLWAHLWTHEPLPRCVDIGEAYDG